MIGRRSVLAAGVIAGLAGCAQLVPQTYALRSGWPQEVPRTVELTAVPFFPQEALQCGPAALATVLAYSGVQVTPEPLIEQVFLPSRHGSLQLEMTAAARRYGRVSYVLAPRYADVLREVAAGNPVIVLQDVNPFFTQWHYAVVNGFDYPSGTIYLRSGTVKRQEMPFTAFEREWMESGYWAMVALAPGRIAATATEEGWVDAVRAMSRTAPPEATIEAYAATLKRWPANLTAAIGLAAAAHAAHDDARAIAALRAAREKHPQSVIVMNNLAQLLSDAGRQDEALALIDKAAADDKSPFASEVRATREAILARATQKKSGARGRSVSR